MANGDLFSHSPSLVFSLPQSQISRVLRGRREKGGGGGILGLRGKETKDVVGNESGMGNFECFVGKKEGTGRWLNF